MVLKKGGWTKDESIDAFRQPNDAGNNEATGKQLEWSPRVCESSLWRSIK